MDSYANIIHVSYSKYLNFELTLDAFQHNILKHDFKVIKYTVNGCNEHIQKRLKSFKADSVSN